MCVQSEEGPVVKVWDILDTLLYQASGKQSSSTVLVDEINAEAHGE